jgi:uncharacterized membrane protein YraQ (UPF0718 family)
MTSIYLKAAVGHLIFIVTLLAWHARWPAPRGRLLAAYGLLVAVCLAAAVATLTGVTDCFSGPSGCADCSLYVPLGGGGSEWLWRLGIAVPYAMYNYTRLTLPVFLLATVVAGLAVRLPERFRLNLPGALLAGALMPVCACGAFPLARSLLGNRSVTGRTALAFLFVSPLLSPYVVFLSFSLLGARYALFRIGAAFLVAGLGAALIARLPSFQRMHEQHRASAVNRGMGPLGGGGSNRLADVMERGYYYFAGMAKYVLLGIVIGAFLAAFVPVQVVEEFFAGHSLAASLGVLLAAVLQFCGGQEVVLLKAFQEMGCSLGFQIAFSLAGTGICLSALPLFFNVLGKKPTLVFFAYFTVASLLVGYALDAAIR